MGRSFEDLEVWQISVDLCIQVYKLTALFPKTELYGISDQVKRSCTSVSANIAVGWGRFSHKEFIHYLYQARGSLMETKSHLLIAQKLFSLPPEITVSIFKNITNLSIKLNNLIYSLNHQSAEAKPLSKSVTIVDQS